MSIKLHTERGRTILQVINRLRDGNGYRFYTPDMKGYFYKAPFPEQAEHTLRDGACSAITYWHEGKRASPTLMLYDLDPNEADWTIEPSNSPM